MKRGEADELPESDAFAGAPHPRFAQRFFGHKAAEAELLAAYREGRLAHAWLIGGAEGVGKATLAWRFARFLLANPDQGAPLVREARDPMSMPVIPRRGSSLPFRIRTLPSFGASGSPTPSGWARRSASTTSVTGCGSSRCRRPSAAGGS
jgi:hypothetical protein